MTQPECPQWETVSSASDGEIPEPLRTEAFAHAQGCGYCGPLLTSLNSAVPQFAPIPETREAVLEVESLSGRERRWLHARWTRWLLAAAAIIIVAEAVPTYANGHGHGIEAHAHAARHLATWQIGFGVGLLVAALMSRLTHAMLALAGTFATLTIAATVLDVINGHSGPWAESVHLIELVAILLLWQLTPPHQLSWKAITKPEQASPTETPTEPPLQLVPPEIPADPK